MNWLKKRWIDVLVPILIFALFIWMRRPEIRKAGFINPDEGDLLAAGKRAAMSLIPYDTYTTSSYGPLWPTFLGVVKLLGLPLTLPVAHLLAACISASIAVLVFLSFRIRLSAAFAAVPTLALGLAWANGGIPFNVDFVQMASELLPLLLLLAGTTTYLYSRDRGWAICLAFAFVGASPFAKYQFGLLAIAAALFMYVSISKKLGGRRSLFNVSFFFLPGVLLLFLTILFGTIGRIFDEAIPIVTAYLESDAPSFSERLTPLANFLVGHVFVFIPLLVMIPLVDERDPAKPAWRGLLNQYGFPVVVLGLSAYSVSTTVFPFPHYLYLLLAASSLTSFFVAARSTDQAVRQPNEFKAKNTSLFFGAIFLVLGLIGTTDRLLPNDELVYETKWRHVLSADGGRGAFNTGVEDELTKICPPGSSAFVWGWAAEMYSYYDWTPVSRYTTSSWQMNPSKNQSVFRERLLAELTNNEPDCVVEAVGPAFFHYNNEIFGIEALMPELAAQLNGTHVKTQIPYGDPLSPIQLLIVWEPKGQG